MGLRRNEYDFYPSGFHVLDDVADRFPQVLVVLHVPLHGLEGVDDGGMVAAGEFPPDLLNAHAGDFPQDIDGNAPGRSHIGVALGAPDVGRGHVEGAGHLADDLFDGHRHLRETVSDIIKNVKA